MTAQPRPPQSSLAFPLQNTLLSRRRFLRVTGLAGVGVPLVLRPGLLSAAPNSKLNHASVGVGGMGANDLQNFVSHKRCQVVAMCDVDANNLNAAVAKVPGVRTYSDWRELLEKEGDKIDSVNVTVPDHTHFSAAYSAIQKGKHVYCQKPMCHDVVEVRTLTRAAVQKGVHTQLGTQLASGAGDRTCVKWLRDSVIGKVKHVYLNANRPGAVENYRLKGPRPAKGEPPPSYLKWDLWLGSAPVRPYAPGIYHPTKWRAWLDFGTGWSGDIGCHIFDAVWKGLDMKPALKIVAQAQESWRRSPERRADTWPQANHITWTFPGNNLTEKAEFTVEWLDGEFYPPDDICKLFSDNLADYPGEAAMIVGTEGALLNTLGRSPVLLPEEKFKHVKRPEFPPRNHYHHFIDACLGGENTESHFAQTGPMTESILLGTVALRVPGATLAWEPTDLKISGDPQAEALLKRTYRSGWHVGPF